MEDFKFILVFVGLIFLVLAFVIAIAAPLDWITCASKAEAMKVPYSWGLTQGCMINVKDHWIPLDSYKVIE